MRARKAVIHFTPKQTTMSSVPDDLGDLVEQVESQLQAIDMNGEYFEHQKEVAEPLMTLAHRKLEDRFIACEGKLESTKMRLRQQMVLYKQEFIDLYILSSYSKKEIRPS